MPVSEISVLWLTAGLSCDGDTIAMTGATQPSLEDLVSGAFPWAPKVKLYNPFLAPEVGDEFVDYFRRGVRGELDPFILVVEGSIPDEGNKEEGYWATFGTDPVTGQPITTCEWIDKLAPKAWAVVAAGTCAAYGGIHAMEGNPTGCMGLPDYLGWDWTSSAGVPIVCIPGCPVQPDNMTETLLYLLHQAAGHAPPITLDESLRPQWLFGQTVHEGCDRGGYYRAGGVRRRVRITPLHRQVGMLGTCRAVQRGQAGVDGRSGRVPQRRGDLHRVYDAGVPRQISAVHGPAAGVATLVRGGTDVRQSHSGPAPVHAGLVEQGTRQARGPSAPAGVRSV